MARCICLIMLILLGVCLPAQEERAAFHDDFLRYHPQWPSMDGRLAHLADGNLYLTRKDPVGRSFFLLEEYVSIRSNFAIEIAITLAPETPSGVAGIVWSSTRDQQDYYALLIRPDGYLAVEAVTDGTARWLQPWTRSRKLNKPGKETVIRLRKQRYGLFVEVDGREEFSLDFPPLKGLAHGLLLDGRMAVSLDYFRIEHPEVDIRLVDDMLRKAERIRLDTPVNRFDRHEIAPVFSREDRMYYAQTDTSLSLSAVQAVVSRPEAKRWFGAARPITGLPAAEHQVIVRMPDRFGDVAWLATHTSLGEDRLYPMKGQDSSWQVGEALPLPPFPPQKQPVMWFVPKNTEYLICSAELPGGMGKRDLWVIERKGQGWGRPINLGNQVNTYGDDLCPYLDEKTGHLYFACAVRPGYGRFDVYRCKSLGDGWDYWASAENVGPGINGPGDDWYFRLVEHQPQRAYLSAQENRRSDFDLYQVRIPVDFTAAKLLRVQGQILNQETNGLVSPSILHVARITRDSLIPFLTDTLTSAAYNLLIPFGNSYQFYIEKPGYYPVSDTLNVRPAKSYRVVEQDLFVVPIKPGSIITLEEVYFRRALPELLPESYPELSQLYLMLRDNPNIEIEIRGHTDSLGMEEELQALSEARAARVKQYLVDRGIHAARIRSIGFGSTQPVASNEDPVTRPLNRRVEFRILKL